MSMLSIAIRVGRHPGLRASNHPPWVGQATVGRLMRLSQRPPLRFASSSAGSFFPATEGMVLLHNPRCSKSRATLQLLEGAMADLTVREYLKDPLTVPELDAVLERLEASGVIGVTERSIVRVGEAAFGELGLDDSTDRATLLAAIAEHPVLMERPIVLARGSARIGRPPEAALELLDSCDEPVDV